MRPVLDSVRAYETWLAGQTVVIAADLERKHREMRKNSFSFFRATCFRFAEHWAECCGDLQRAPLVPSVGDVHVENFGTWRDAEGRLIWGVNDFDEAALLPATVDLVRLAASALLDGGTDANAISEAILSGYRARLPAPRPFVLDEQHGALREASGRTTEKRKAFWEKLRKNEPTSPPRAYEQALLEALPSGADSVSFAARRGGLGSLGRQRFIALAQWRGGPVAREAKARVPSSWLSLGLPGIGAVDMFALARAPTRVPDPWFRVELGLTVRRLAPDNQKIEADEEGGPSVLELLGQMGEEVANIHACGTATDAVLPDLARRPTHWLRDAAQRMADRIEMDHQAWR